MIVLCCHNLFVLKFSAAKLGCFGYIVQIILKTQKMFLFLPKVIERLFWKSALRSFPVEKSSFMDTLDRTDLQILRVLQENGRLTIKELASKVSLSSTPVYERLRRLEGNGYIKKYIAVLDAEKLNQGFIVFCNVKLKRMNRDIAKSGSTDYLLKIHATDMKAYNEFLINKLGAIESLGAVESMFVMSEVKHSYGLKF